MLYGFFPTESGDEAMATLRFCKHRDDVALFIVGRFGLTHGARVAQEPASFGLSEVFFTSGDDFRPDCFSPKKQAKRPRDHARIDEALDKLSSTYLLRHYPWAGALSTAHTILITSVTGVIYSGAWQTREFRAMAAAFWKKAPVRSAHYDLSATEQAEEVEQQQMWQHLIS